MSRNLTKKRSEICGGHVGSSPRRRVGSMCHRVAPLRGKGTAISQGMSRARPCWTNDRSLAHASVRMQYTTEMGGEFGCYILCCASASSGQLREELRAGLDQICHWTDFPESRSNVIRRSKDLPSRTWDAAGSD